MVREIPKNLVSFREEHPGADEWNKHKVGGIVVRKRHPDESDQGAAKK
jgi:hypothetical protein